MYANCLTCNEKGCDVVRNTLPLRECPVCALAWRKEFSLPKGHYEERPAKMSEVKFERRTRNSEGRLAIVRRIKEVGGLCDIGSAEGTFLAVAKENGMTPLLGLDPIREAVEVGESLGVEVCEGRIEDLKKVVGDFPLKTATMFHVIEHLENPLASLEAIFAALPRGGHLVIETPNMASYALRKSKWKNSLVNPEHFFYFNEKNLHAMLKKAGFHIVAHGRRQFDEDQLPIRESLYRLGILGTSDTGDWAGRVHKAPPPKPDEEHSAPKQGLFKSTVRYTLAKAVKLLGRSDYQWVIARK